MSLFTFNNSVVNQTYDYWEKISYEDYVQDAFYDDYIKDDEKYEDYIDVTVDLAMDIIRYPKILKKFNYLVITGVKCIDNICSLYDLNYVLKTFTDNSIKIDRNNIIKVHDLDVNDRDCLLKKIDQMIFNNSHNIFNYYNLYRIFYKDDVAILHFEIETDN